MNKKILIVGITLILWTGVFTGCLEENGEEYETMSYTELCADLKKVNSLFTLQSYKYDDTLYIQGVVLNVTYFEGTEQSLTLLVLDLKNPFFNSTDLPLAFLEDRRDEFTVGSTILIPVHVKVYNIEGETLIWLEEWYIFYMAPLAIPP